jgi:asparagine synthase (glutamine-hydrolysing)
MCGICGYINPEGARDETIECMTAALRHRGPDGQGLFTKGPVALGHRRLSIIDLEGGRQPMANEDGSMWITFNGEIYNYPEIRRGLEDRHQFKTRSDTEVILHLYEEKGEKCLDDLRGMFAFAIYDYRERKLFAARDHLGQKPLYYHHDGNRFSFASEIKALLVLYPELAELDETALYEYLTLRIIAPPRSMFRKIRKLPPAHFLVYQDGKISIQRYWHLRYELKLRGDFRSVVEELENQMLSTVRYHLVSDVPVGAFLSGGMDSSLIVAMMSQITKEKIKTFSGDVPYKGFSEIRYAMMVSERYGTEAHNLTINPSLIRSLPDLVWHLDEPSDPLSVCMYYISELARKEVKVVLGGDGGDELFGGYDRYYGNAFASYYAILPAVFRKHVLERLMNLVSEGFWYRSFSHKMRWLHRISFYQGAERYSKSLGYFYFSNGFDSDLYTESFRKAVSWFDPEGCIKYCFSSDNAKELVDRMLYADTMIRMPDHPVMILDRMTMAHGLESRSPFLDHKLAEFCATIPPSYKIRGKRLRYIQVELAKKYLPPALIKKKKQGFSSPLTYLLADEFRFLYKTFLKDSRLISKGYLNPSAVNVMLKDHLEKKYDHGQRLWLLCNAEIWYRMYIEGMKKDDLQQLLGNVA